MRNILIYAILIIFLDSCHAIWVPKDVRIILRASGDNRPELEKVIDYYRKSGDNEKLQAAYFLIGNMDDKYAVICREALKYEPIFELFDSLQKINKRPPKDSPYLSQKWDSLLGVVGPPSFKDAVIIPDYSIIKADYLISDIDLAFKTREESKWGEKISFDKFLEFVVAYRFNHEPLERWRSLMWKKYNANVDSARTDSIFSFALAANKIIPHAYWYKILMSYPYDIPATRMDSLQKGSCRNIVTYNTMAMRSIGLPIGIDYAPRWANSSGGHDWNVIFTEGEKPIHFERGTDTLSFAPFYKPAKVYRKTFGRQHNKIPDIKGELPEMFFNDHRIDVTHEYSKTYDVEVPLIYPSSSKNRLSVICTFDNSDWFPQDWGKIKHGKAFFKNIGSRIVYLAMYYNNGNLTPASDPFILQETGKLDFLIPSSKKQDMKLLRKYHFNKQYYFDDMVGGCFEGSNIADFTNCDRLFTIEKVPSKIEIARINNLHRFKYVRYRAPYPTSGNVGELEFYGGNKSTDTIRIDGKVIGFPEVQAYFGTPYINAFDGDPATYFDRFTGGLAWVGLAIESPKRITKIRYCPRSDTNFILVGDTYELCFLENGVWVSMGTRVATDQFLVYNNVPSDALYILHNHTSGREERIFTYENGIQVWW